jgi:hypothetical protein
MAAVFSTYTLFRSESNFWYPASFIPKLMVTAVGFSPGTWAWNRPAPDERSGERQSDERGDESLAGPWS